MLIETFCPPGSIRKFVGTQVLPPVAIVATALTVFYVAGRILLPSVPPEESTVTKVIYGLVQTFIGGLVVVLPTICAFKVTEGCSNCYRDWKKVDLKNGTAQEV